MDRTKKDEEFLDTSTLGDSIDELLELMELIKFDLIKAKNSNKSSGKYTMACLYRARQALVNLEKKGLQFRKISIQYEKENERK